jgi:hypothetical protein
MFCCNYSLPSLKLVFPIAITLCNKQMANADKETDLLVGNINPQLEFQICVSCNRVSVVSGRVFVKTTSHFYTRLHYRDWGVVTIVDISCVQWHQH